MNFQNTTERLNNAGKRLKEAGIAYIIILGILIFTVLIASNTTNMNADEYLILYILSSVICFILTFVIAIKLVGAGEYLMEITFNKKEEIEIEENESEEEITSKSITKNTTFNFENYPLLMDEIKKILSSAFIDEHSASIIISFCKNHTLSKELANKNKVFVKKIVNSKIKTKEIQTVFQNHKDDEKFILLFESFLESTIIK
tara:strand:- start:3400 stop:4005 length:606 start_codon:yes stop_codon:yes gene_type:complete